ncbi:MAG: hypothetical protein ACRDPT_03655 [Streptomycetales bacterium]
MGAGERIVYLHIGAPKTGTTYLQDLFERNRGRLAADGVLWPGRTWGDQVLAVRDLIGADPYGHRPSERGFRGVATVAGRDPRLGRPGRGGVDGVARQCHVLAGVTAEYPGETTAGRRFWQQHDLGAILRTWGQEVPPDRTHLLTVPPREAAADLLWQRFASVIGVEPDGYDTGSGDGNQSLGVVSAELMRRLNIVTREQGVDWPAYDTYLKWELAKGALPHRQGVEARLAFPRRCYPWAVDRAERLVSDVARLGPRVVGDLRELVPSTPHGTEAGPADATAEELLDAALFGIATMVKSIDTQREGGDRLRRELDEALAVIREHRELPPRERVKRTVVELGGHSRAVGWALGIHRKMKGRRRE